MTLDQEIRAEIAIVTIAAIAAVIRFRYSKRATRADQLFTIPTIMFTGIYSGGLLLHQDFVCLIAFLPALIFGTVTSYRMIPRAYSGFPAFCAASICGLVILYCLLFGFFNTFGE